MNPDLLFFSLVPEARLTQEIRRTGTPRFPRASRKKDSPNSSGHFSESPSMENLHTGAEPPKGSNSVDVKEAACANPSEAASASPPPLARPVATPARATLPPHVQGAVVCVWVVQAPVACIYFYFLAGLQTALQGLTSRMVQLKDILAKRICEKKPLTRNKWQTKNRIRLTSGCHWTQAAA